MLAGVALRRGRRQQPEGGNELTFLQTTPLPSVRERAADCTVAPGRGSPLARRGQGNDEGGPAGALEVPRYVGKGGVHAAVVVCCSSSFKFY